MIVTSVATEITVVLASNVMILVSVSLGQQKRPAHPVINCGLS